MIFYYGSPSKLITGTKVLQLAKYELVKSTL